jgi:hypothetical protein
MAKEPPKGLFLGSFKQPRPGGWGPGCDYLNCYLNDWIEVICGAPFVYAMRHACPFDF